MDNIFTALKVTANIVIWLIFVSSFSNIEPNRDLRDTKGKVIALIIIVGIFFFPIYWIISIFSWISNLPPL